MSTGYIHSFQSLGTVDGPGVRFVVFLQGCCLRCACCHNPDTWEIGSGTEYTANEVVRRAERYRNYFGAQGGITLSGGEPLLQPAFVHDVFQQCHTVGIHTCLDTAGAALTNEIRSLLNETDRVLLDWKFTNAKDYHRYTGGSLSVTKEFLAFLNHAHIPVTLRQVIIPTLNDSADNVRQLAAVVQRYSCIDTVELLPFRKLCQVKYDKAGIAFPLATVPEPSASTMHDLNELLKKEMSP